MAIRQASRLSFTKNPIKMTKIHFLNVGHGDCTIIEHPSGNITMIDINNARHLDDTSRRELAAGYGISGVDYDLKLLNARSQNKSFRELFLANKGYNVELTNPVDYYLRNWGKKEIFRYIQTHADLDHMRGLKRLNQEGIQILNFWDTTHQKNVTEFKDTDEIEWTEYQRLRKSTSSPKVLHNLHDGGKRSKYWNLDDAGGNGDGIHILAPTEELRDDANKSADTNAHSYVLWLEYAGIKVVLGGDATDTVWKFIYGKFKENLKCHVLKASHHGRDSGYSQEAVKAMSPDYVVVSVGTKPETDATNKYRQYCKEVWSTRWKGNIILTIPESGQGSQITAQYP